MGEDRAPQSSLYVELSMALAADSSWGGRLLNFHEWHLDWDSKQLELLGRLSLVFEITCPL